MNNKQLGRYGEVLATLFLNCKGYVVKSRNFSTSFGELDIVAKRGKTLVFIEVKTRSGTRFGRAADAVTPKKRERIHRLAAAYCHAYGYDFYGTPIRFDVIEVYPPIRVRHIVGCF